MVNTHEYYVYLDTNWIAKEQNTNLD